MGAYSFGADTMKLHEHENKAICMSLWNKSKQITQVCTHDYDWNHGSRDTINEIIKQTLLFIK